MDRTFRNRLSCLNFLLYKEHWTELWPGLDPGYCKQWNGPVAAKIFEGEDPFEPVNCLDSPRLINCTELALFPQQEVI